MFSFVYYHIEMPKIWEIGVYPASVLILFKPQSLITKIHICLLIPFPTCLFQVYPTKIYENKLVLMGASLVDQYTIKLVHIVGFKILKIEQIYCRYWGDEGFKVGVCRVVYKDWGIKRGGEEVLNIGMGFQQKESGSISLEIKGILRYHTIAGAMWEVH